MSDFWRDLTMRNFFGWPRADCSNVIPEEGNEEAVRQSKGMMQSWPDGANGSSNAASSASTSQPCSRYHPYVRKRPPGDNVLHLLALREVIPSAKRLSRRLWSDSVVRQGRHLGHSNEVTDAKQALVSWVEAESLRHCTAKYCPLQPAPRSTIAAAFSPDGNTLASTHGDHTVKIICCRTGQCLKVLSGHRRTPWVVRFHPGSSEVLASGSLDNEVRLWDANTAECVGFRDFSRPIASLAFHAQGDLLAVASGHKLYIWQYTREADVAAPVIVLRTRRSLRAVHFHPHAAPLLLTAEVNDLDSPDCPMSVATSRGFGNGASDPQPVVHVTGAAAATIADDGAGLGYDGPEELETDPNLQVHHPDFTSATPMDVSPRPAHLDLSEASTSGAGTAHDAPDSSLPGRLLFEDDLEAEHGSELLDGDPGRNSPTVVGAPWDVGEPAISVAAGAESGTEPIEPATPVNQRIGETGASGQSPVIWPVSSFANMGSQVLTQPLPPRVEFTGWELPFLHGWVQGQNQSNFGHDNSFSNLGALPSGLPIGMVAQGDARGPRPDTPSTVASAALAALANAARIGVHTTQAGGGQGLGAQPGLRVSVNQNAGHTGRGITIANIGAVEAAQAALAAAQAAAVAAHAAAELPCTVKLRIWPHDIKRPSALLDPETCRLTIPHAVLCSEMGAHFSPCGRFLAACVACILQPSEADMNSQASRNMNGSPGAGGSVHSPTQHPISAQQVIYELRVYSLEEATFGQVLSSRAVRAAHCLTSIQFSPTSGHILLAYGRRHSSLLRSLVVDGNQTIPIYTILEVYRVSDMELVRVLPSAEDEVNVACFHPRVGGGLVYGTKEGKLRILQHDRTPRQVNTRQLYELEEEFLEAERADPLSFRFVPDVDEAL